MKRTLVQELNQFAASHELDGERRTADLLCRAKEEIVRLSRLLVEIRADQDSGGDRCERVLDRQEQK